MCHYAPYRQAYQLARSAASDPPRPGDTRLSPHWELAARRLYVADGQKSSPAGVAGTRLFSAADPFRAVTPA